jgi:RluA family pseudouridine synthase
MRGTVGSETQLLDYLQAMFPDSSRTTLRQMLQADRVRVNGKLEKYARRGLTTGDTVDIAPRAQPQLIPPEVAVLFEDDDIIVIFKEVGLLTVATPGEQQRTAQAFLNDYLSAKKIRERIHVVHRLDRDTSGVLVFARNFEAREALKEQFAAHHIDRVYIAVIEGAMPKATGTIRSYLREDRDFTVRSVRDESQGGKLAITHYHTQAKGERYSRLQVTLETGRKNQIRAHLSESGHPVVGDKRYGAQTDPLRRLGLHAAVLGFRHPLTGKALRFEAPLPDSFRSLEL